VLPLEDQLSGEDFALIPVSANSTVLANSIIAKSGQGKLFGFTVYNSNASSQFILLFDANSLPADGATAACVFTVAGSSNLGVNWDLPGRWHTRGIVLCNSSTEPTKTIGAGDCFFDVQYV